MIIIGICGASGSGKSTLAEELYKHLKRRCIYLSQDSYYRDRSDIDFEARKHINYDDPKAFEHDVLSNDLRRLRAGQAITTKRYDYTLRCRCDSNELIQPADIVLVEGIHVFYDPQVLEMLDFKIFIQVDPDVCLMRRVQRDIRDRGRSVESIYEQYLGTVKPMYEKYIRNYANDADLIVAGGGKNARIIDMLVHYIDSGFGSEDAIP